MRWNDLSEGSIKTLLILALLAANIALAFPRKSLPAGASTFSRDQQRFGAVADNSSASRSARSVIDPVRP
jgi:hypothetical protein